MPRILTYNVHRCVGLDRRLDVGRIAAVIAALEPDIVALQELDVGRARTGGVDQAHEIARRLEMAFHFHAALKVEEEQYGDAILTRFPERLKRAGPLPRDPRFRGLEPRGALWIEADIDGQPAQILNTHFGLTPREQSLQARGLAGPRWLGAAAKAGPVILTGDFNAAPGSPACRALAARLDPAWRRCGLSAPPATFPAALPLLRIDHMFVSEAVGVARVFAPFDRLTRAASDHLPLVMDFALG